MARTQTKIEQLVRAFCDQHDLPIWDSGESYTIIIGEDHEYCITYHDGYERAKQREVTAQWRDAYDHLIAMVK
jgi:hypothetical protein